MSLATHKAHSEDSDQTGRMSRLISESSLGAQVTLLVLSYSGSYASRQATNTNIIFGTLCFFCCFNAQSNTVPKEILSKYFLTISYELTIET